MWFLNYCSPFIFDGGSTGTYRIVMYSELLILFTVYLIFTILYRFAGTPEEQRPNLERQHKDTLRNLIRIRFCNQEHWISSKLFKQWYLCYFGMHSVSIGICIMYSPYLPQMIFAIIHLITFLLSTILKHFFSAGPRKALEIVYMILMALSMLLNIMLLFSGTMGVGASGYDENAKICLLQSGTDL